jgi:sialate O-acetylesterase
MQLQGGLGWRQNVLLMKRMLLLLIVAALSPCAGIGAVKLPAVFSDHAVLQRGMPVPVWGWADPGAEVTVSFAGQTQRAKADAGGNWRVVLKALDASAEPRVLRVQAGAETREVQDVLVGEVWVASGQSNMEWPLNKTEGGEADVAAATHANIRLLAVPRVMSLTNQADVAAAWTACTPEAAREFSAVGYHFSTNLHAELKVPVGIIRSAWGGTRSEPWTPMEGYARVTEMKAAGEQLADGLPGGKRYRAAWSAYFDEATKWMAQGRLALDAGGTVLPPPAPPAPPVLTAAVNKADGVGLFQGMIAPLIPYAIRGAIWYQGESNRDQGALYAHRMQALIRGWRAVWGQGDFPFYFVQIAPFKYDAPMGRSLPELWRGQLAATREPNTGMVVINDIGNPNDIHPGNKRDVGRRLALMAFARTYGRKDLVHEGPKLESMTRDGGALVLKFGNVAGKLATRNGQAPATFEIAGTDGRYAPAVAAIEPDGISVRVSSPDVPEPTDVRHAWWNTAAPNLMNGAGLPCTGFESSVN